MANREDAQRNSILGGRNSKSRVWGRCVLGAGGKARKPVGLGGEGV